LIRHEDLEKYTVADEYANRKNDPIDSDYVLFKVKVYHFFEQEDGGSDIRGVIERVSNANKDGDHQVHFDVIELT